jgi:hypothetical protein
MMGLKCDFFTGRDPEPPNSDICEIIAIGSGKTTE